MFGDIQHVHIMHDDILIEGASETEHDKALKEVLDRAVKYNIKFNPTKIQFKRPEVLFHGVRLTRNGVLPDQAKVEAVREMPNPTDKAGVLRFLGMINYLAAHIRNASSITEPLRNLIKNDTQWLWGPEHDKSMQQIKDILSRAPLLRYFDPKLPLSIQADASSTGLGACLLQQGHPIAYASRSLSASEIQYAQIEKELLAILFAAEKFHYLIYGKDIEVLSDHKPLETIFKQELHKITPRLQLMRLKLLKYKLNVKYTPGSQMFIADTLSRAQLPDTAHVKDLVEARIHSVAAIFPATPERMQDIKEATKNDKICSKINHYVMEGWPTHRQNVHPGIVPYWQLRDRIYEDEGLLLLDNRIIIPAAIKQDILTKLHEGHFGQNKCKATARQLMYWPTMIQDIELMIQKCTACATHRSSNQKEPLLYHAVPEERWMKLGADLCDIGEDTYLVIVDYYSKYPEICKLSSKSSEAVIKALKSIYARHGIPKTLISDNVPFASQAMHMFAKEWGFTIVTSSPRYPRSNGQAERYVGIVKTMLKKVIEGGGDPQEALLQYHNSPITVHVLPYSPAQLLFLRRLRGTLPITK
jgi:hypothetical protein